MGEFTSHDYAVQLLPQERHESMFGGDVIVERAVPVGPEETSRVTDVPVYFGNGYAKRPDDTAYIMSLAARGREAFAFTYTGDRHQDTDFLVADDWQSGDPARYQSRKETFDNYRARAAGHMGQLVVSAYKMQEAATLLGYLEQRGDGQIDAVFQSADALTGTVAMHVQPERFRNVWLAYGAGLAGSNKPRDIQWGHGAKMIGRRVFGKRDASEDLRSWADQYRDPDIGSTPEPTADQLVVGGSVLYSNHVPLLHSIASKPDGPNVTLVAGLHDGIFTPERILGSLASPRDASYIVVTDGGHSLGYNKTALDTLMRYEPDRDVLDRPLSERLILPDSISDSRAMALHGLAAAVDARG